MSGADLVAALRHDRTSGFEALYREYAQRLYAYAATVMKDSTIAADATHDALIQAVTRIDQLRDPERLEPWLFAITRNECFKLLRTRSRVVDDQEAVDMQSCLDDADAALAAAESQTLVREALGTLSAADRDVLALALRNDLDTAQVADAMGISTNQVRARLSRARTALTSAVTALLLARDTSSTCSGLAEALAGYDGRLSPLLRKRVSRHARSCSDCEARGNRRALAYVSGFSVPVVAILPRGFEARAAESVAQLGPPETLPDDALPEDARSDAATDAALEPSTPEPSTAEPWEQHLRGHLGAAADHDTRGLPWAAKSAGVVAAGLALVVGAGLWQRGEVPITDSPQLIAQSLAGAAVTAPQTLPSEGGPDRHSRRASKPQAAVTEGRAGTTADGTSRTDATTGADELPADRRLPGSGNRGASGAGVPGQDARSGSDRAESGQGGKGDEPDTSSPDPASPDTAPPKPDEKSPDPPDSDTGPTTPPQDETRPDSDSNDAPGTKPPAGPSQIDEKQPEPPQTDPKQTEAKQPDSKQPAPTVKDPGAGSATGG